MQCFIKLIKHSSEQTENCLIQSARSALNSGVSFLRPLLKMTKNRLYIKTFSVMPVTVAGRGKVCRGSLFHSRRRSANFIDSEVHVTAETILIALNLEVHAR